MQAEQQVTSISAAAGHSPTSAYGTFISATARETGVPIDTLRRWEAEGLLKPARVDGWRIYSAEDKARILDLRNRRRASHSPAPSAA